MTSMIMKYIIFSILLTIAAVFGVESAEGKEKLGTLSFYFENDFFGDTDRYYTNGIKLSWISPDLTSYAQSGKLPEWALPIVHWLPFINDQGLQRNIGLSMGQNIYTPRETERKDLIIDDRPYAGWTYFGIAFHSKNERRLDSMEIQLGMVGPLSFAEQTQKFVHRLGNWQCPEGWEHQINNEPGVALVYERKWRFFKAGAIKGAGFDVIPHLGGALGNVCTYANAGVETRLGWNVPSDFGISLIRPAGDANAPASLHDPRLSADQSFGLNLFALINGRAVARDIFLDGNTFTESHSVNKRHFVADCAVGIGFIIHHYKVSLTRVLRTEEFKGQKDAQSFGSLTFSYSW